MKRNKLKNEINILILFLIIFSLNTNCNNKTKKSGYIKIKNENLFKINYSNYIDKSHSDELTLSFPEFPHSINPYRAVTHCELFFKRALFSSLFYLDPDTGLPEKNLIKDFTISNDGLVIKITLKDNIKFNNGSQLDCEDVISSLSLLYTVLKDSEIYKNFFILNKELKLEQKSSKEFIISSDIPNGNLLYALSNFPIIPKDSAEKISQNVEAYINFWDIKTNIYAIGSGPYKIEKIEEDKIILSRNQFYFNNDKNNNTLPYTKKINVKFYIDKKKEILGFVNNETDIISIEDDDYKTLKTYFKQKKSEKVRFIETNYNKNRAILAYNCYKMNSKSYLKDNEFRKYISHFIKESLKIEEKKDKSKNKQIKINDNLFKNINNDNILEYKDGTTIFLRIITIEEESQLIKIAYKIKNALEELNFDVNLEVMPSYLFFEKMFISSDYDIGIFYYDFDPGIISYYTLLNKNDNDLSFYPFVFDNYKSGEMIFNKIEKCIFTFSNKNQSEEIKKLQNILEDINQLFPVLTESNYYLARQNIFNFKINSSLEDGYNLKTIETLIRTP